MDYTQMGMRDHATLIQEAGGPAKVAAKLGISSNVTKAWKRLNSIPAPYWMAISQLGFCTLEELAVSVAKIAPSQAESEDSPSIGECGSLRNCEQSQAGAA